MILIVNVFGEGQSGASILGEFSPVSVVIHHLLKELPSTFVGNNALALSRIIRRSADLSMAQVKFSCLSTQKTCFQILLMENFGAEFLLFETV